MKKVQKLICGLAVLAFLGSCTVISPYAVSEAPVGSKTGVSSTGVILGAIELNDDYGIADAVKNGKITGAVSTVDQKITYHPFAFIFYNKELIVTGE